MSEKLVLRAMAALLVAACNSTDGPQSTTPLDSTTVSRPATSSTTTGDVEDSNSATTDLSAAPRDNAPLVQLLESAAQLAGVTDIGWDESHGAPYALYVYRRGEVFVAMVSTNAEDDELAISLLFTEGQEPLPPGTEDVDGWPVLIYPANDRGTSAVHIENVCENYDLWASWTSPDTATIADDLVQVAKSVDCPT